MKYGQREVLELMVFDEEGNLVCNLDSLKNSGIYLNAAEPYVLIKDALLDTELLKFIGKSENKKLTDYERLTGVQKYKTTITLGLNKSKKCMLVGKGIYRESSTMENVEFMFEIPEAIVSSEIDLNHSNVEVAEYDIVFGINPFNEDGDAIKIHIE